MRTVLAASITGSFIGLAFLINGVAEPLDYYAAATLGLLSRWM